MTKPLSSFMLRRYFFASSMIRRFDDSSITPFMYNLYPADSLVPHVLLTPNESIERPLKLIKIS